MTLDTYRHLHTHVHTVLCVGVSEKWRMVLFLSPFVLWLAHPVTQLSAGHLSSAWPEKAARGSAVYAHRSWEGAAHS